MRILFTGASSFTGCWFVQALVQANHEVTALLRGAPDSYTGARLARVCALQPLCDTRFGITFGDEACLALVREQPGYDMLCHHAATTAGYREPGFDVAAAVAANVHNMPQVLDALISNGCGRVLLTGSVFEAGQGGIANSPALLPYGQSKTLTTTIVAAEAALRDMAFGHFVIPNPFGPLEEPRYTTYLARSWHAGERPTIRTPHFLRDNIHVDLLAAAYAGFCTTLATAAGRHHCYPSGYVETQANFTARFARELGTRLSLECGYEVGEQQDFSEPIARFNSDDATVLVPGWDEAAAWERLAMHYAAEFGS